MGIIELTANDRVLLIYGNKFTHEFLSIPQDAGSGYDITDLVEASVASEYRRLYKVITHYKKTNYKLSNKRKKEINN